MELVSIYEKISVVGYVLAVVFFLIAVFLFFYLNIPKIFGLLSGITARKTIEGMRNGTVKRDIEESEDDESYQNYNIRMNSKASTTASLNNEHISHSSAVTEETMDLNSYENKSAETMDLSTYENKGAETMDLSTYENKSAETMDLSTYENKGAETMDLSTYENKGAVKFVVEEEITFVHSDERISYENTSEER